ncbi:peptide-methionine (S)-S-oxide reductase MsrA [Metamycoplasma neophronis]|uniref:Peptide methionine sulfoxide reductase MsrA n=1 Tax=Metamycoplasma neophronis TaxID=872983 RepID=A0ABY2YZE2_9BACT|nr:peptide-methionine (S)-S-oxide reductase MsrA [Metamycoplasma neophronis]TPR53402.1 peptide-methionine (S)-S-oxide reductase MsrA [Metamycoplasma neophronis]
MEKEIWIAGGCFWGVQWFLRRCEGVIETKVGYANSDVKMPSYEQVKTSQTNAVETTYVKYDDTVTDLKTLITKLFTVIDPTAKDYQGEDIGSQYRNGIYYVNDDDKKVIKEILLELSKNYTKPLATEVLYLKNFYLAEEYHQDYLEKNPNGYCHIKTK